MCVLEGANTHLADHTVLFLMNRFNSDAACFTLPFFSHHPFFISAAADAALAASEGRVEDVQYVCVWGGRLCLCMCVCVPVLLGVEGQTVNRSPVCRRRTFGRWSDLLVLTQILVQ